MNLSIFNLANAHYNTWGLLHCLKEKVGCSEEVLCHNIAKMLADDGEKLLLGKDLWQYFISICPGDEGKAVLTSNLISYFKYFIGQNIDAINIEIVPVATSNLIQLQKATA